MNIADRVKKARKEAKLSQLELAQKLGISQQSIAKIEKGETLRSKHLVAIARALNVSLIWLQFGSNIQMSQTSQEAKIAIYKLPLLTMENFLDFTPSATTLTSNLIIDKILHEATENARMVTIYLEEHEFSERMGVLIAKDLDAMLPLHQHKWALFNGDKLVIDFNKKPTATDLVLIKFNDAITIRQLTIDADKQILKPLNPQYPIITDNFEILGTIIQIIRKR